jgi:Tfp pilus assembly protein PilF
MRTRSWLTFALVLACIAPLGADKHSDAHAQVEFGIAVARKGLWKEAMLRWKKAIELDPGYVPAYNDLAIAYEQLGQLANAREMYEKALSLDRNDATINQNYEQFREVYERQKTRQNIK